MRAIRQATLIMSDVVGFIVALAAAAAVAGFTSQRLLDRGLVITSEQDVYQLLILFGIIAAAGVVHFKSKGHYNCSTPWWHQVGQVAIFCVFAFILEGFINYSLKTPVTRLWVGFSWVLVFPSVLFMRLVARWLLLKSKHWATPVVVVGGVQNAIETVYALKSEAYIKYDIKQVCLPDATPEVLQEFEDIHPNINLTTELPNFDAKTFVVLCPDHQDENEMNMIFAKIAASGAPYSLVPPFFGISLYGLQPKYFFGHNIVLLEPTNRLQSITGRSVKWLLDKTGASLGIIALSPLFLYLMYQVSRDGGSPFYHQMRVGKGGELFKCYKFRSMVTNADSVLEEILSTDSEAQNEYAKLYKLKDDPRITKIGHTIRKWSIDELPQLFNVLKGDMSLVGPRPIVPQEIEYFKDKMHYYESVRPGITGLWQVSGRNDISYAQRVRLDSWYVKHWTFWNDIVILFKTIHVVLARKGAY